MLIKSDIRAGVQRVSHVAHSLHYNWCRTGLDRTTAWPRSTTSGHTILNGIESPGDSGNGGRRLPWSQTPAMGLFPHGTSGPHLPCLAVQIRCSLSPTPRWRRGQTAPCTEEWNRPSQPHLPHPRPSVDPTLERKRKKKQHLELKHFKIIFEIKSLSPNITKY